MRTIIIPFFPRHFREEAKKSKLNKLVNAAWKFAHCALWPERSFVQKEVDAAKDYIGEYLLAANDMPRAFKAYIQRIALTRNYLHQSLDSPLPVPSVWFNARYPIGFAGSITWLQKVERQRKEVDGYLLHLDSFAQGYYTYSVKPTTKHLNSCREKLLEHHAGNLLQLFYSTIIHTHYISA